MLDNLRRRFPGCSDGILFCILKLQENPDLGLRDFRHEAELLGLRLAGRSLHSARVMLGLSQPARRRTAADQPSDGAVERAPASPSRRAPRRVDDADDLVHTLRQLHTGAASSDRMRQAITEALRLIRDALA